MHCRHQPKSLLSSKETHPPLVTSFHKSTVSFLSGNASNSRTVSIENVISFNLAISTARYC